MENNSTPKFTIVRGERSYDEVPTGTRVRLMTNYRTTPDYETYTDHVVGAAGKLGTVRSCSHAGFNGRVHSIRLDDGTLATGISATDLRIVR